MKYDFSVCFGSVLALFVTILASATSTVAQSDSEVGGVNFPEIIGTNISGAPRLSQPVLIMGSTKPIHTEKHGLAAPALWDWNGDGKKDLLVGEFETCMDESFPGGSEYGSAIRVYLNSGTENEPAFTDEFEYARDTEGNVIEVGQW